MDGSLIPKWQETSDPSGCSPLGNLLVSQPVGHAGAQVLGGKAWMPKYAKDLEPHDGNAWCRPSYGSISC